MAGDYRVIVTGSRLYRGPGVYQALAILHELHGTDLKIIVGDASEGADQLARAACRQIGIRFAEYKADWRRYPRAAGYIRNKEMARAGADECIAFPLPCEKARCANRRPHNTHGTQNMMDEAARFLIPVRNLLALPRQPV